MTLRPVALTAEREDMGISAMNVFVDISQAVACELEDITLAASRPPSTGAFALDDITQPVRTPLAAGR